MAVEDITEPVAAPFEQSENLIWDIALPKVTPAGRELLGTLAILAPDGVPIIFLMTNIRKLLPSSMAIANFR